MGKRAGMEDSRAAMGQVVVREVERCWCSPWCGVCGVVRRDVVVKPVVKRETKLSVL